MKNLQIIFGFCFALVASCTSKTDNKDKQAFQPQDPENGFILNKEFNVEIRPDTTLSWYIIEGLKSKTLVTNKKFVVQKSLNQLVLHSNEFAFALWPANLPSFINIGDTIIVSGKLFQVPKRERMPGNPIVISNIFIHTTYRNKDQ